MGFYALKPGIKQDPVRQWGLPDRIFFGYGACHILAGVFLSAPPLPGFYAEKIIPDEGFWGNHIYVTDGVVAFDFHGYSGRERLLDHHRRGWSMHYAGRDPDWGYRLERVEFDLLNRRDLNARHMRGPDQYLHDAIPRARRFIARIDHKKASAKALSRLAVAAI